MTDTQAVESGWIEALAAPRSEPASDGTPPGADDLRRILGAATTVPDHGGLRPWRFVLVAGAGQRPAGRCTGRRALRDAGRGRGGRDGREDAYEGLQGTLHGRGHRLARPEFERAGLGTGGVRRPAPGTRWSSAPTAFGFGAVWKSAAVLESTPVRQLFDLDAHEQLLGWVNIGSPSPTGERRSSQRRPEPVDLTELVTVLDEGSQPLR